jgi:sulfate adenylyltransferase (ADP) / ATP adenylyltransferase
MFAAGTLWEHLAAVSRRALDSGALQPIETQLQTLRDREVPFAVRRVVGMPPKPAASPGTPDVARPNPFLPYDPALHVADATPTHVCLLNKFNVFARHLLIVTRQFEHQETPLHRDDFTALWRCMAEFPGLGFYNSGTVAGASQPHKHLQLVPLPLGEEPPAIPIEVLLRPDRYPTGEVVVLDEFPFANAAVFWDEGCGGSPFRAAELSQVAYQTMLDRLGVHGHPRAAPRLSRAYNLLVHRRWMLMVLRRRECFQQVSLNALAFAGALLVRGTHAWNQLQTVGPWAALRSVSEMPQP